MTAGAAPLGLVVRDARSEEFDEVGRLTLEAYEDAGILGTDPGYRAALLDAASRATAPGRVLVAADSEDRLLGAVAYCPWSSLFAEISGPGEAEFRMLAVAPFARRSGVARALIAACRSAALQDGLTRLVLSVIDHNAQAAAVYERLGFDRAPDRDWEPVAGVLLRVWQQDLRSDGDRWCGRCGRSVAEVGHEACRRALDLEPPRYCPICRRRMVVQVMPAGWTARCSEHGPTPSATE